MKNYAESCLPVAVNIAMTNWFPDYHMAAIHEQGTSPDSRAAVIHGFKCDQFVEIRPSYLVMQPLPNGLSNLM